ncbi:MAG: cupin domain-containing protein [Archangium sp.]|nr:cupin domain-containing protein [Archangium sp.]
MTLTVKNRRDIAAHTGPGTIPGIRFRSARQALGVSAWGMNVIELDPSCTDYPAHNHDHDRQEELYVVLEGEAVLKTDGAERVVRQGDFVRVPPEITRQFITRGTGVVLLAIGGTPGRPYAPDERIREG